MKILGNIQPSENIYEYSEDLCNSLYRCNQTLNEEWQYEYIDNGVQLNLFTPERSSLDIKYWNIYSKKWKKKIESELKLKVVFEYLGKDPELPMTKISMKTDFYILHSNKWSPLLNGEKLTPIPYYKIPYTCKNGDSYDDLYFWNNNYKRVEELWFSGEVGEKWTQTQLQNYGSELNKQGLECRKRIEELTNIPTFYFLFNYRGWGQKKDRNRKCPSCGGNWLLDGKTNNDYYAFICEKCRLISELSSNS